MRRRRLRRRLLAAVDGIERRRGLQAELLRAATSPPPVEAREWVISAAVEGLAASTTAPLPALRLVAAQQRSWQRRIGPLKNSKRRTFFISTRATSEQKKTRQKKKKVDERFMRGSPPKNCISACLPVALRRSDHTRSASASAFSICRFWASKAICAAKASGWTRCLGGSFRSFESGDRNVGGRGDFDGDGDPAAAAAEAEEEKEEEDGGGWFASAKVSAFLAGETTGVADDVGGPGMMSRAGGVPACARAAAITSTSASARTLCLSPILLPPPPLPRPPPPPLPPSSASSLSQNLVPKSAPSEPPPITPDSDGTMPASREARSEAMLRRNAPASAAAASILAGDIGYSCMGKPANCANTCCCATAATEVCAATSSSCHFLPPSPPPPPPPPRFDVGVEKFEAGSPSWWSWLSLRLSFTL